MPICMLTIQKDRCTRGAQPSQSAPARLTPCIRMCAGVCMCACLFTQALVQHGQRQCRRLPALPVPPAGQPRRQPQPGGWAWLDTYICIRANMTTYEWAPILSHILTVASFSVRRRLPPAAPVHVHRLAARTSGPRTLLPCTLNPVLPAPWPFPPGRHQPKCVPGVQGARALQPAALRGLCGRAGAGRPHVRSHRQRHRGGWLTVWPPAHLVGVLRSSLPL